MKKLIIVLISLIINHLLTNLLFLVDKTILDTYTPRISFISVIIYIIFGVCLSLLAFLSFNSKDKSLNIILCIIMLYSIVLLIMSFNNTTLQLINTLTKVNIVLPSCLIGNLILLIVNNFINIRKDL